MSAKRTDNKGRVLRIGESQRKDLTYMYRYTDKWGKRHSVYAPTLQELREKEKTVVVAETRGVQAFNNITLMELMERLCALSDHLRDTTKTKYLQTKNLVSKYAIAQRRVRDIKKSEVKLWLLELLDDGYAAETVRVIKVFCHTACQLAIDDDVITKNPFAIEGGFLPPSNKRTALTEEEQERILSFMQSDWSSEKYIDFVIVLIETGLRLSEFLGLIKSDVDFDERVINVQRQLTGPYRKHFKLGAPKTSAGKRTIPLSDKAYAALKRMVERADRLGPDVKVDDQSGFIVIGQRGALVNACSLERAMRRICEKYNKVNSPEIHFSPHVLRHTYCTNMINRGYSPTTVQYFMGHSRAATTLNVYTHANRDAALKEFRDRDT